MIDVDNALFNIKIDGVHLLWEPVKLAFGYCDLFTCSN